jgi:putative endonuclease
MAEHNEIGKIGEEITKEFLVKHGFSVLSTNYRTRYGEIDIVAEKDKKLRFVEVKSVKVRDFENVGSLHVKPEDNLTGDKWRKFVTSAEIYLNNRGVSSETLWQLDLACVYIDTESRRGKVVLMENVHKE